MNCNKQKIITPKPHKTLRCVICGSNQKVERHHIGGQFHVAWFTIPLCNKHHLRVTEMVRVAGINLSYTLNKRERFIQILKSLIVFLWLLTEMDWESK